MTDTFLNSWKMNREQYFQYQGHWKRAQALMHSIKHKIHFLSLLAHLLLLKTFVLILDGLQISLFLSFCLFSSFMIG